MTPDDRNLIAKVQFEHCMELLVSKAQDYAEDSDSLANFKRNASALGLSKYQVWAVYFGKHTDTIFKSVQRDPHHPATITEGIFERITDAINYLVLLRALLEEDDGRKGVEPLKANDPFSGLSTTP